MFLGIAPHSRATGSGFLCLYSGSGRGGFCRLLNGDLPARSVDCGLSEQGRNA